MYRRNLLTVAIPAALLTACTKTQNGPITTYTLDTARIHTDASAIITALSTSLSSPSIVVLLGSDSASAQARLASAKAALAQFDSLTNGAASVSVDTSQAKAVVMSLITDAQTVLSLIQGVTPNLPAGPLATAIGNYVAAALTLIPLLQLAVGLASTKAGKPLMSEADAIRIANH